MVASTETKLNQAGSKISVSPMGQVSVRYDGPPAITVDQLVTARNDARKAKNFTEADRIRNELAALGVVLHDTKDGTTWEIAR
jgi:cysteinyl-tRNA synthetase